MSTFTFPHGFLWGTATAAYQIEGAATEDGRGESIWDRFAHTPGKTHAGESGDIACDHYHRWREDIALMKTLGLQAYRFSIAWPRILPTGTGAVNQKGLDFYSQLVDGLLEAGITPFATLYHWDLPQALQDAGGWPARATSDAFVAYADVVSRALGDRVKHWITHNEPWCISFLSHEIGQHAPGLRDWNAALSAAHTVLVSHGRAVPVLRSNSPGAEVGITLNFTAAVPASPSPADYHAARSFDGYFNRWFLDPIYGRHYPADMWAEYVSHGYDLSFVQPGDFEAIAAPTDFLGVNYYTREVCRGPEEGNLPREVFKAPATALTDMAWEIYPEGLYRLLVRLHVAYDVPKVYVTENGAAYPEEPDTAGVVADERRLTYLRQHFAAVQRALAAGAPVAGFFVWSFMDNYEWAEGYTKRFGIVHVDYETQKRTFKNSALWYQRVIAAHSLVD
jgi:beta-glucosidase